MRIEPPVEVTRDKMTFDVSEIEPFLRGPALDMNPWPDAMATLKDGRVMFIREAKKEEVPAMLEYLKKMMEVEHDFYDIVGVRLYAELLGWYRNRLKDPYVIVGLIDGVLAGLANGRMFNEEINISHHTMTFQRGGRIGAVMYYCKAYYAFEVLDSEEFWSTFESYNGWRLGFQQCQPSYPWPENQHELGGARIFYITRKYWDQVVKDYTRQMVGTELVFDNIPDELVKANESMIVPEEVVV
ncbi:MAG: N-acetyltransferase [Ardenticatenia bacterium]|nr:N-acetyltransferase [Ardenticatenia bacterium]